MLILRKHLDSASIKLTFHLIIIIIIICWFCAKSEKKSFKYTTQPISPILTIVKRVQPLKG